MSSRYRGGSVTSVSGWEEAEGEGRGGGRENEMGGGGVPRWEEGGCHSTCLLNRCRAEEGVTRPRASSDNNSTEKILG